jgi:hypothetical protein
MFSFYIRILDIFPNGKRFFVSLLPLEMGIPHSIRDPSIRSQETRGMDFEFGMASKFWYQQSEMIRERIQLGLSQGT